jgi:uncharacterized protein
MTKGGARMTDTQKATAFYGIAFGLAALSSLAACWIGEASFFLMMLTPTVAALAMLFVIAPEGRARDLARLLGLNRPGLRVWPLAILAPFGLHLAGLAVLVATGLTVFVMPPGGLGVDLMLDIVIGLIIGTVLALGEEIGWRGYLLPRLTGRGALRAMLVVGFLHGVWHLPLLLGTDLYHAGGNKWIVVPLFLVTLTLAGVFYGVLRLRTGSVWPVALAHGAVNMGWNLADRFSGTTSVLAQEYIGGESGLIVIAGLCVLNLFLLRDLQRHLDPPG